MSGNWVGLFNVACRTLDNLFTFNLIGTRIQRMISTQIGSKLFSKIFNREKVIREGFIAVMNIWVAPDLTWINNNDNLVW